MQTSLLLWAANKAVSDLSSFYRTIKTNKNSTTTIVAAMTSQIKNNLQTHVKVSGHGLKKESLVLLEQIRTIDKVRLMQYIGRLGDKDMKKIDRALTESLSIKKIGGAFKWDNKNCAFYYEVNLLQVLLREGYISETDYHAIVSLAKDDLKSNLVSWLKTLCLK